MARWFQHARLPLALAVTLAVLAASPSPAAPSFLAAGSPGTVSSGYLTEASGLAASRQNPGVLWTHNDSAFPGSVFALATNGTLLARHLLPIGNPPGYNAEDLALGPGPDPTRHYLYLGDIGDNLGVRPSLRVYRFPEPAVYPDQPFQLAYPAAVQVIVLTYPDGPHNAEAMMVDPIHGDLYIVTKALSGSAGLYRASAADLAAGGTIALTLIRPIGFLKVSAGDISPDGRLILLRSGNNAAVWSRAVRQSVGDALGTPAASAPVMGEPMELNGESVAFDPAARGYFTLGEGLNQPLFAFRRTDAAAPPPPAFLVAPGDPWRFRDQGTDPGPAWPEPAFDDRTWSQGRGQLGYGQGDERTFLSYGPDPSAKPITTFFRRTFMASDADRSNRLVLRLCYTDGVAVHLNGTEILRRNLDPAAAFDTPASGSNADLQNAWSWFPVPPTLLVPGTNVLAVELHRLSRAGATLSFDAQLISHALDHSPDGTDPGEPPDTTAPRVAITSPAANSIVTNEVLLVRGTASDNIGLARVAWRLGNGPLQAVTGPATWSIPLPLEVGTNVLTVLATDFRTNTSLPAVRTFIRRALSPLTVQTDGPGSVSPALHGRTLLVGNTYTLTAAPAPRHLFAGWNGGLTSAVSRLTFVMESNLTLQARFVTNPFLAAQGTYRGLAQHQETVSHERSGPVTVTVTEGGAFSASLRLGGTNLVVTGPFDLAGRARRTVAAGTLTLELDLTPGRGRLTGEWTGAGWTSTLLAYRVPSFSATHPCPWAGRYTLALAGSSNGPASGPRGHGVAALNVLPTGAAALTAVLADGTKVTQASAVSSDGLYPLALTLYGNRGSLLGWLALTNPPLPSLQGQVNWVRKPGLPLPSFPSGFTNTALVTGSAYSSMAATQFFAAHPTLCLTLRGVEGEPESPPRCLRRLGPDTYGGDGFRSLRLPVATGLGSGLFTNPVTRLLQPVGFILLQADGTGWGHLRGTHDSAAVELSLPR